jgi:hypothetical protein
MCSGKLGDLLVFFCGLNVHPLGQIFGVDVGDDVDINTLLHFH